MNTATITIPKKVLEEMYKASAIFERTRDQLEDYMLSQKKSFVARTKNARREHNRGKTENWEELKSQYGDV